MPNTNRLLSRSLLFILFNTILFCRAQDRFPSTVKDFSDRILKFHSEITVEKDGDIIVREHITIYNGNGTESPGFDTRLSVYYNDDIKRGLVRDFPTLYSDTSGYWYQTGFSIKSITKNGTKEPYSTESLNNGKRIKIGREEVMLTPGIHQYVIEYETDRQLIFHQDKDELYWNVNGNGWVFTADTVSCVIRFPEGSVIKESRCYTGITGSTTAHCVEKKIDYKTISFTTNRKLEAYEGLTVGAAVQKGIISPPSEMSNMLAFLKANYILPLLIVLLLFLFTYYFYVWYHKGRDPRKGIIYPQFSPPPGITAADAGYIIEQKFSSNLFAAALIDCAVKKNLNIEVSREGLLFRSNVYTFTQPEKSNGTVNTRSDYGFDTGTLYGQKAQKGKYNSKLRSCYNALHEALKERFLIRRGKTNKWHGLFVLNRGYIIFGTICIVAGIFFFIQFITTHPSVKIGVISVIFLLLMIITHVVFSRIMSAYTKKGREIVDHLLGFRMYLRQAEQHIYQQLTPPEKTLELFEKYLPYAVALGVENEWASKFDSIMEKALAEGYRPSYYSFSGNNASHFRMSDISSGISSGLTNTISSASTPPSSSRGGSGGGGSSGGGGGGGGGGGW